LNLYGNLLSDLLAPRDAVTFDVVIHSRQVRKITICDRLTLGAAEFFGKPSR
jgi:hypothetical protein